MQFDTVEILEHTSDELLKACGMKGGEVALIRRALKTMNHKEIKVVVRIFHLLVLFLIVVYYEGNFILIFIRTSIMSILYPVL